MKSLTPAELLGYARQATDDPGAGWGQSWARIAAFLTRTALERSVGSYWTGALAPMNEVPTSTQLVCLSAYVDQPQLVRRAHATWAQLSGACHAHAYELPPTVEELHRWIDVVSRFSMSLGQQPGEGPSR